MQELFGKDEAVKLALAANLFYYHDDPDRTQFLRYAIPQASYLVGGGRYIRGGSQALTDQLTALIVQAGGVLQAQREADRLLIDGNGRIGVSHHARNGADQCVDRAPLVFGNAAPQILSACCPRSAQRLSRSLRHSPPVNFIVDGFARFEPPGPRIRCQVLLDLHNPQLDAKPFADARCRRSDGPRTGRAHAAVRLSTTARSTAVSMPAAPALVELL